MERYQWDKLTKQQLGKFAEYFVKMELTMFGFQVFGTEVDERGIDFIARFEHGPFLQVQVKSVRGSGYVYMEKTNLSYTNTCFWHSLYWYLENLQSFI